MQQFMERSKLPLKLTYRAVGSSTGQAEFAAGTNDFGSGDIPLSTDTYSALEPGIVQLPIVLGAISLFHSIPNVPDGIGGLNLTSCLIARIFKRQIVEWDHPDILTLNPNLRKHLPHPDYPVTVAHRKLGSSSTASITAYLHDSCPQEWSDTMVGKTITWPDDTLTCEGSGGMTNCIRNNPGTIGYIDSGHGHSEGLVEIELQNLDKNYLSSKEAAARGGIGAAAGAVPSSADANFADVSLLNQPGPDTWPIVTLTYVYVRKDLSHLFNEEANHAEQSLLVTFLRALYEPAYIDQCANLFGFTPVPERVRNLGLAGIQMLQVNATAPEWSFETSTLANTGQGDYVLSVKRRTYAELQRSNNMDDVEDLLLEYDRLSQLTKELRQQVESLQIRTQVLQELQASVAVTSADPAFTDLKEFQLKTALSLAALSFVMCTVGMLIMIGRFFLKK
eukprot:CAMPEP_0116860912 /NCGR_PEP_ID=MMETSP0418-20121206/22703_1 /TAXON_ID=1158023 /ORGANISM="Astrosyne radiata, Strain 13vi08-1A" /LENGTH=448 /DNA_ID=CAMNT_0004495421 /DNA_START=286 /DNA_END=1632 /DNA_ORIENTATION=-